MKWTVGWLPGRQQSVLVAMVHKATSCCPLDQLRCERKLRDLTLGIEVGWVQCRLLSTGRDQGMILRQRQISDLTTSIAETGQNRCKLFCSTLQKASRLRVQKTVFCWRPGHQSSSLLDGYRMQSWEGVGV